jgi:BlaI family transcriptional regulator, penicillinase repressor
LEVRRNDRRGVRKALANGELGSAYTTIATLVRILVEKGFLKRVPGQIRPYRFRAIQNQEDVSARILADILSHVFQGSREQLFVRTCQKKD